MTANRQTDARSGETAVMAALGVAPDTVREAPSADTGPDDAALGAHLLARNLLSAAELARVQAVQRRQGGRLGELLASLGLVAAEDWAALLAELAGVPLAEPADYPAAPVLPETASPNFLKARRVLPLALDGDGLRLAMADPFDDFAVEALARLAGVPVHRSVASAPAIAAALEALYRPSAAASPASDDPVSMAVQAQADIERLKDLASEAPVVRLLDGIIARAVELRASDIHLEPFERRLRLRLRVDGLLREEPAPSPAQAPALVSRIKILARLNIAERRLAQDGRIRLTLHGRRLDLRVSTVPSLHGESVVIRLLEPGRAPDGLDGLGFGLADRGRLQAMADAHHGIVLVTGPTGSGKTTTLYALLTALNAGERKLVTVEDPVEYDMSGVVQIQVNAETGLDFPVLLRSLVRHDPDVIMVGEMRDRETATVAVQAALTGHLVLSTLHTNDAPGALTRLLDMGVPDYLLVSTLRGVVAQRLVRRLCRQCRRAVPVPDALARRFDLATVAAAAGLAAADRLFEPVGCTACHGSGYAGRLGLFEVMTPDAALQQDVIARRDHAGLRRRALEGGMTGLFADGLAKALAGETSLAEIGRVAPED